jgi:uncharacterized membrane protein
MDLSSTKNIYLSCFFSIFLIVVFVISPLSNFSKTSCTMKIIVLILLGYTFYLSILQTNKMKITHNYSKSEEITKQININIICSYVFTFFTGLLIVFIIKSLF